MSESLGTITFHRTIGDEVYEVKNARLNVVPHDLGGWEIYINSEGCGKPLRFDAVDEDGSPMIEISANNPEVTVQISRFPDTLVERLSGEPYTIPSGDCVETFILYHDCQPTYGNTITLRKQQGNRYHLYIIGTYVDCVYAEQMPIVCVVDAWFTAIKKPHGRVTDIK